MKNILFTLSAFLISSVLIAQPANDDCDGAVQLTMGGPEICIPIIGDNTDATNSGIAHGCANYQGGDIWFAVLVPSSGSVELETSGVDGSELGDGGLAAYTGTCGDLTQIGCNDDGGAGLYSKLSLCGLTPGTVVYAAVWEYGGNDVGEINICAYQPPACPEIGTFDFFAQEINSSDITFTWPCTVPDETYTIEYGLTGFDPGSGMISTGLVGTDGPPAEITGLESETTYDFYLTISCPGGGTTNPVVRTYTTSPVCPDIFAFTFQVDSSSVDALEVTWDESVEGSMFNIEYGLEGFTPGTGTVVTGTTGTDGPPVLVTGLELFTAYDFYLFEMCNALESTDTIMQTFLTAPGVLTNDDCETATPLTVGGPLTCDPITGFNNGATDSGVPHNCAFYQGGDVWFSFVAPESGGAFVETMAAAGGIGDGGMALYSGECGSLVEIDCDDDGGIGLFSYIEAFGLTPGETYYVAVWEYGGDNEGAFDICVYEPPTCPDPDAFSFNIDTVTMTDATISWASINTGGTYVIEVGEAGFVPGTGTQFTGIVGTDGPPVNITGLTLNTNYEFYFQVECAVGDSSLLQGPFTFSTLAEPPVYDNLCNAIEMTVGDPPIVVDNSGATAEPGETAGTCWGGAPPIESIWASFEAPESGFVTVTTDFEQNELTDTHLTLYELNGACDDFSSLNELGCDEDDDNNLGAGIFPFTAVLSATDLTPGSTYYIQVDGWDGQEGEFGMQIFDGPVGLEELEAVAFNINPNPADNLIYIKSDLWKGIVRLDIMDIQGKAVIEEIVNLGDAQNLPIDISSLVAGAYLVRLTSDDGFSVRRLIIE